MGNLEITQIESNWDFSFLKVNVMFPYSPVLQSLHLEKALKSGEHIGEVASYINGLLHSRESVRWLAMSLLLWTTFKRFLWANCASSEETACMKDVLLYRSSSTTPRTAPTAYSSWDLQTWRVRRTTEKQILEKENVQCLFCKRKCFLKLKAFVTVGSGALHKMEQLNSTSQVKPGPTGSPFHHIQLWSEVYIHSR